MGGIFGHRVRLRFGNMDVDLALRWEDLNVEEGATVSAVIKVILTTIIHSEPFPSTPQGTMVRPL